MMLISSPSFTGVSRFGEESDVFVVEVDVDETVELVRSFEQSRFDAGRLRLQAASTSRRCGRGDSMTSAPFVYVRSGEGMRTFTGMCSFVSQFVRRYSSCA